ncbi:MAG: 50S ribosomal protein L24 [Flavobacteriales bacterium]|nr:MAG: 50S ribosomal protein L24 [Flavobacteriales bacterium]
MKKFHIKSGDTVKVISGAHRGKSGKVLSMVVEKDRAVVEGVNIIQRHTKPTPQKPQGGIVKSEAPIHISNLMLVDPATGEATRTGRRKDEAGKSVRYSKKTNEVIK